MYIYIIYTYIYIHIHTYIYIYIHLLDVVNKPTNVTFRGHQLDRFHCSSAGEKRILPGWMDFGHLLHGPRLSENRAVWNKWSNGFVWKSVTLKFAAEYYTEYWWSLVFQIQPFGGCTLYTMFRPHGCHGFPHGFGQMFMVKFRWNDDQWGKQNCWTARLGQFPNTSQHNLCQGEKRWINEEFFWSTCQVWDRKISLELVISWRKIGMLLTCILMMFPRVFVWLILHLHTLIYLLDR